MEAILLLFGCCLLATVLFFIGLILKWTVLDIQNTLLRRVQWILFVAQVFFGGISVFSSIVILWRGIYGPSGGGLIEFFLLFPIFVAMAQYFLNVRKSEAVSRPTANRPRA